MQTAAAVLNCCGCCFAVSGAPLDSSGGLCDLLADLGIAEVYEVGANEKGKSGKRENIRRSSEKHRMECKMTQEFLAEALGMSHKVVSKWESGVSDLSTSNLIALVKLFGTTAEKL